MHLNFFQCYIHMCIEILLSLSVNWKKNLELLNAAKRSIKSSRKNSRYRESPDEIIGPLYSVNLHFLTR